MTVVAPAVALVRATRPRQWIKNLLVAAVPVAASDAFDGDVIAPTLAAIGLFTMVAGAVYLFNDVADIEVDRAHPVKRRRPIAASEVTTGTALGAAGVLAVVGLVCGFALDRSFGLVLALYLALNLAYSRVLKHVPWVDLAVVASGFVLRAVAGGTATDLPVSGWFIAVVCGGSLFMVTGKRAAELQRAPAGTGRSVLRAYPPAALRAVLAVSAGVAVLAYAGWVTATSERIGWLAVGSLIALTGALARYAVAIDDGRGEHPEDVFLHDLSFQLFAGAWAACYLGAIYG